MAFRPFQDRDLSLGALQGEMNRMFDRVWHSGVSMGPFDGQEWGPLVDGYENSERFRFELERVDVEHVGEVVVVRCRGVGIRLTKECNLGAGEVAHFFFLCALRKDQTWSICLNSGFLTIAWKSILPVRP